MTSQQFSLSWNNCQQNLLTSFEKLFYSEHFVDVSLAVETEIIKCHKVVLSAYSAYFEKILINNPCQHPVIIIRDMKYWEVLSLVNFMYKGEVSVEEDGLDALLKAAEALQIRGLTATEENEKNMSNNSVTNKSDSEQVIGQPENKAIRFSNHKVLNKEMEIRLENLFNNLIYKGNKSEKKGMPSPVENSGNLINESKSNHENDTLNSIESQKSVIIKEEIQMEFETTDDLDIPSEDNYIECDDKSSGDPLQLIPPHPGPAHNFSNLDLNATAADYEQRLDGKPHFITRNINSRRKTCAVCSNRKTGNRKETVYLCETCKKRPGLHPGDCFRRYHTMKDYKTK